ncbi:MAG: cytochrome c oxidase subunit 3 [Vicinamibacterales bacterium]
MIPYTVERRADTGVTNVTLGIWLFLASEVMLFGALFSAYALLRTAAPAWPSGRDVLDLRFALANTVVLLALGWFVWRARTAAPPAGTRRRLWPAAALGLAFLVVKSLEYRGEITAGLVPATSTFLATYFVLTGLHALHVAAGIVANLWVVAGAGRVPPAMTLGRTAALSLYWMFVDVVWIVMLVLLYLS